ncbi:hypothetical protein [Cytobacillus oceanisediminis]|uniref:hypothetical protein n=1 Tax=Cytobacillus oceanisediminis TaxID=665099 RepID=UPI002079E05F|nr:hypothetical protein [Cytobacillus oceanisediminis]USK42479.1 hypothetical protein LIT27_17790 [Cytobacillus oceanisediminis]
MSPNKAHLRTGEEKSLGVSPKKAQFRTGEEEIRGREKSIERVEPQNNHQNNCQFPSQY